MTRIRILLFVMVTIIGALEVLAFGALAVIAVSGRDLAALTLDVMGIYIVLVALWWAWRPVLRARREGRTGV